MHNYKELEIWKASVSFCTPIYKLTANFPDEEKFGIISQLRRAVISVPSNIAKGSAKSLDKHFLIFLENSLGSCFEIETQLLVSKDLNYIKTTDYELLTEELTILIKMLIKFMKYLQVMQHFKTTLHMKKITLLFTLFISIKSFSQNSESINLSKINFCELSIDDLEYQDADLKEVKLEEMDFCTDGFLEDHRFINKTGYESKLYPGVIFQQYRTEINVVAKIHLTKEFKGYLPDGNYVDLKTLKAEEILKKYDSLDSWTSRGCSDYWGIKKGDKLKFYVKIKKDKEPRYPVDIKYYSEQPIEGIDIISDCSIYEKPKISPLYIVDTKEVSEEYIRVLKPEDVETVTVLKEKSAVDKYGEKGKNGVIEIKLKKK